MYRNFNFSVLRLDSYSETKWQNHMDSEILVVVNGAGYLCSNENKSRPLIINECDVVYLPPFKPHLIKNTGYQPLKIVNIWWMEEQSAGDIPDVSEVDNAINLVLPSFTTPNGKMHIGHLAGPSLNADIFKRAQLSAANISTYQLCGTIGYQTHVCHTAKNLNLTYIDTSLKFSSDIIDNYQRLSIDYDTFVTLNESDDLDIAASNFIDYLLSNNYLVERIGQVPYCVCCDGFIFEADVKGTCPFCNNMVSSECEFCAIYIPDDLLLNPVCTKCDNRAIHKPLKRMYIKLEPYRCVLQGYLLRGCFRGNSADFVDRVLSKPLPDIPLSIIAQQGVSIGIKKYYGHKLYSAIELVPRFIVAFNDLCGKNTLDTAKKAFNLYMFFGKDNSYLRCILFPILLSLYKLDNINIKAFFSNEFYLLDGSKFSTSRNNVVYVKDLISEDCKADWVRWYLVHADLSIYSSDFNMVDMSAWIANLKGKLWGLIKRLNIALNTKCSNLVPEPGIWENRHKSFYKFLDNITQQAIMFFSVNYFNSSNIANLAQQLLIQLEQFLHILDMDTYNNSVYRTTVAISLLGLKVLCCISWPLMPNIMYDVFRKITNSDNMPTLIETMSWLKAGTIISNIDTIL